MSFTRGVETGTRMARSWIDTFNETSERTRERRAADELAAYEEQFVPVEPTPGSPVSRPAAANTGAGITTTPLPGAVQPVRPAASGIRTTPFTGESTTPERAPVATRAAPTAAERYRAQQQIYLGQGLTDRAEQAGIRAADSERYEAEQARQARLEQRQISRDQQADMNANRNYRLNVEQAALQERQVNSGIERDRFTMERARGEDARRTTTSAAVNAALSGEDLTAVLADPNVDAMTVLSALSTQGTLQQQQSARAMQEGLMDAQQVMAQTIAETGETPSLIDINEIAAKYNIPASTLYPGVIDAMDLNQAQIEQSVAASLRDLNSRMTNVGKVNEWLQTDGGMFDPVEGDGIAPEIKELVPGVWGLTYGGDPMLEAGLFGNLPNGMLGWQQLVQQAASNIAGDPVGWFIQRTSMQGKPLDPVRFSGANLTDLYKTVSESPQFRGRPSAEIAEEVMRVVSDMTGGQQTGSSGINTGTGLPEWPGAAPVEQTPQASTTTPAPQAAPAPEAAPAQTGIVTQPTRGYAAMRERERAQVAQARASEIEQLQAELASLTTRRGGAPATQTERGREIIARLNELMSSGQ